MLKIKISIRDFDKWRRRLLDLPDEIQAKALPHLAQLVFDEVRDDVDVHTDTGDLLRSLGNGPRRIDNRTYEISHDLDEAPHAPYVHWGTRDRWIFPNKKKALHWISPSGKKMFSKGHVIKGYKGDPWMVRAQERVDGHAHQIIQRLRGEYSK